MRRVFVEQVALDDLDEIFDWIAADNPSAAERVLGAIDRTIEDLSQFATGRAGRVDDTFEKVVAGKPCLVIYQLRLYEAEKRSSFCTSSTPPATTRADRPNDSEFCQEDPDRHPCRFNCDVVS